jgi:RNA polymerase sigma-70 factor (ECF subfamily)
VKTRQHNLYQEAAATYKQALERLVRAYEADADKRRDLLQDIHLALWESFLHYESRCSLRTWVYRVAHNTAASHVVENRSTASTLVSLQQIESAPDPADSYRDTDRRMALERLLELIHRLKPFDRQLMLLYLEDIEAESIGEIVGMSAGNVRVQVHRIKAVLARRFHGGNPTGQ